MTGPAPEPAPEPVPVTTIGGYLGAGKTTLINATLRHAAGRRLAVLVNEFGALPIDQDLIEAEDGNIISIAGGCICCSFGDDLIGALRDLSALDPPPDHILIEASGVAIPASVAANMSLLPACAPNGVVVLADAETVRTLARDKYLGDTILRQLADADLVVITKTDLVSEAEAAAVASWVESVAARAAVFPARQGQVPPDILLGPVEPHAGIAAGHHADALFESIVIPCDQPLDAAALARRLGDSALRLVRAKGFVRDLSGQTFAVQVVGNRWQVSPVSADLPHAIVCIARAGQLDETALARVFDACQDAVS